MNESNQRELVACINEIDNHLGKLHLGRKVDIYLFGGAAAVIAYACRRGTVDLDVYSQDRLIEAKLLEWGGHGSQLEKKYGIYVQSANTTFMLIEDPEWRERSVEILKGSFKNLRLLAVSKEDLILSKLGRYNARDQADIEHLIKNCGVKARTLIDYYKSGRPYYACDLKSVDLTFNIVLKEYYNLKPIAF